MDQKFNVQDFQIELHRVGNPTVDWWLTFSQPYFESFLNAEIRINTDLIRPSGPTLVCIQVAQYRDLRV